MFIGGVMALITAYFTEGPQEMGDPGAFLSLLILVILISNIICHNLYAHLLRKYSATFLAFAGFLGPLFSAFYGWIFLGRENHVAFLSFCRDCFCGTVSVLPA